MRATWNAQANPLVIALLFLAASGVARGRWWSAAFLLSGPVFLKLSPLAVALLFCALWPRQLIGRFLIALAVGALVPFLTRPADIVITQYHDWLVHLTESNSLRWPGLRDGWTVYLVLEKVLIDSPRDVQMTPIAPLYHGVKLVMAGAVLAWCLWLARRGSVRLVLTGTLGMGLAWLMIFGPATEFPTYVLLAPLIGWAVLEAWRAQRGRWLAGAAFVLTTFLPWTAISRPLEPFFPLIFTVLPVGSACFAGWLAGAVCWLEKIPVRERLPRLPSRRIIEEEPSACRPNVGRASGPSCIERGRDASHLER
jgi:hypothetical protein